MTIDNMSNFIADLPIDEVDAAMPVEDDVNSIDLNALPDTLVTGGNIIDFSNIENAAVKSAVALSLLAAQRVAKADTVITTPDEWVERHNLVLSKLNWAITAESSADSSFKNLNIAVHEAIIPFLTAALGPAAAAGSLIITALEQLKQIDKDRPWITLFEKESRRFSVQEYQFSTATVEDGLLVLRLAAARLDAKFGRTQVLFIKVNEQRADFKSSNATYQADPVLLETMNSALRTKLAQHSAMYLQELEI